ncbi:hypothetical protein CspeluHIS016_0108880 [Cutaneotrichosporon spelunceum]|uniref:SET domain-containing protein n=1 Tax=Cutaneotrichosporon spelunceum TaxID=1672016 RepID=A0AAD3TPC6_9TREE|nr:hypothetical protein CspeluHIS016_0108880 [Cutaneotrichosporon spelunceum]
MKLATVAAALALAAGANAQISIPGLSTGCTTAFAGFIVGDLSSCLQVTALLPVLSSGGNSSAVPALNGYLSSLCASSTPTCTNATLSSAASRVRNGCTQELANSASIPSVILTVLDNYTPIQKAACSKNTTNNEFCVTDSLNTIQNISGTDVTFNTITSLLGGSADVESQLQQVLGTGDLCTGCVAGIYNAALEINSGVAGSSVGQAVTGQCGADFGMNVTGVSTPSAATGTPSQAVQSTTPSGGAASATWGTAPPPAWPEAVAYLTRARLAPSFPHALVPLLYTPPAPTKFGPRPTTHPSILAIKVVTAPGHPAHGQRSLIARKRLDAKTFLIPYLGILHADFTDAHGRRVDACGQPTASAHEASDYDLSLVRLSASDVRNPFGETSTLQEGQGPLHVSIGVDAAQAGNAARFVNDFRGIATAPNAEFRLGRGDAGEAQMEVWSTRRIEKGDEILVSYGKGWWGART